jgi:hypothetical protein
MAIKNHAERLAECEQTIIKINAKLNAVLWVFGVMSALGAANIIIGFVR